MAPDLLTVWDSTEDPGTGEGLVFTWNGLREGGSVQALLAQVESDGERLRARYLAWIHEVGESRIEGRRLIDWMALNNGLSYWWMTPFVEKSPWNLPVIVDALRLLVLESVMEERQPTRLRLVSANARLHEVLRDLCVKMGLSYEWRRVPGPPWRERLRIKRLYRKMPIALQAFGDLARFLAARWPLRASGAPQWFAGKKALFFCSYFFHLDAQEAGKGHFHSRQWGELPSLAKHLGHSLNWLQHYYPHDSVPTPAKAAELTQRFNTRRDDEGVHAFLDSHLSVALLLRVAVGWFALLRISWKTRAISGFCSPPGSRLSLWPLVRDYWHSSLFGGDSVRNLLWIELFESAMKRLPRQEKGFFLCENLPWERAFIHSWRRNGHGMLIGVVHATVRFWDLRYFSDPRTLQSSKPLQMPSADLIALNGRAAVDAYFSVEFPKAAIAECEALRYGHLSGVRRHRVVSDGTSPLKVLVVGDFTPGGTDKMLKMLQEAAPAIGERASFVFKAHSNSPIKSGDYPGLKMTVTRDTLGKLLPEFDAAYAGNMTSAAVDAYLAGLEVVVMRDEDGLNFSPLRGHAGVQFVRSAEELKAAIRIAAGGSGMRAGAGADEFFFLDPDMPRWKRLLA